MHQNVKYSPLLSESAQEEMDPSEANQNPNPAFEFGSVFKYDDEKTIADNFKSQANYGSAFKYRDPHVRIKMAVDTDLEPQQAQPMLFLVITSWVLSFLSYAFFVLTIPISYWFLVKKLGEFDRLVVFRLGKMIGVKGPGRFIIFPWMDRTKKIDVRAAAFAVPPQQFITVDGGIVEMGAEIQYGIVDVVTMVTEVADHQDILRSLGKTLLVKILVKKTVTQLEKDKRLAEGEIMDEVNDQVRKWGINVHSVALSATKILKQPESGSNTAVGSILKGLGMKEDPKYPTPQEFVRSTHGFEEQPTASLLGNVTAPAAGSTASMNMSLLQSLTSGAKMPGNQVQLGPGIVTPPTTTPPEEFPANWGRCLEVIINNEFNVGIEPDAHGVYKLEITETEAGKDVYFIELSATKRAVTTENVSMKEPDVYVTIASPDLANVLDGSLAPLQAYLTGRISATGDVKKLMFFDKLSKRGHKPGSMFSV